MSADGCWSTIICSAHERAALGATSDDGWVLGCRLSIGHSGNHATDAERIPRYGRRLWLEWNDIDDHALSLIERNPCSAHSASGARCMLFEGHPGTHWFAPTNGHATGHDPNPRSRVETLPRLAIPNTAMLAADPEVEEPQHERERREEVARSTDHTAVATTQVWQVNDDAPVGVSPPRPAPGRRRRRDDDPDEGTPVTLVAASEGTDAEIDDTVHDAPTRHSRLRSRMQASRHAVGDESQTRSTGEVSSALEAVAEALNQLAAALRNL